MEKINAFVGHSFEDADKEVVRTFLDYLTTLSKLPSLNFSWEHAEEAQTMAISRKVKEKIVGKNLFIGIFTKKERVIKNNLLSNGGLFRSNQLTSNANNYEWKSSDWVLQELGYCLGKDMSAIILLEKDVRPISGLQADHEFIQFDRSNPTACFERILQQISSTNYKSSSSEAQTEELKDTPLTQPDLSEQEQTVRDWKNPDSSWNDMDYFVGVWFAVKDKDIDTETKIYNGYIKKHEEDLPKVVLWEAQYLNIKRRLLNQSAIGPIKELIRKHPTILDLHVELAYAYEGINSYDLAFEECDIALKQSSEFNIRHLTKAVDMLQKSQGSSKARNYLKPYLSKIVDSSIPNIRFELLKLYGGLFKEDYPHMFLSLSESALAIQPDDSALRFSVAYKYSELDLFKQAAYHYKILTHTTPTESNWNNLGVAYSDLNLVIKSIDAYTESSKLKGTLAKSNLANKLLSAGFADQAKRLCNDAMSIEGYDERVAATLEAVNTKLDAEKKIDDSITEDTKLCREFSIPFSKAFELLSTNIKAGLYKAKDCNLDVTISENQFKAYGIYEKDISTSAYGLGLLSGATDNNSNQKEQHQITYEGEIFGDTIVAKVSRKSGKRTILGDGESSLNALIYYSTDELCFYVLEFTSHNQNSLYKIMHIQ